MLQHWTELCWVWSWNGHVPPNISWTVVARRDNTLCSDCGTHLSLTHFPFLRAPSRYSPVSLNLAQADCFVPSSPLENGPLCRPLEGLIDPLLACTSNASNCMNPIGRWLPSIISSLSTGLALPFRSASEGNKMTTFSTGWRAPAWRDHLETN